MTGRTKLSFPFIDTQSKMSEEKVRWELGDALVKLSFKGSLLEVLQEESVVL